jgi:hypothetical protein
MLARRTFLGVACACIAAPASLAQTPASGTFICPPCGCSQDANDFDKPGVCPDPACGMDLIPKPAPAPAPGTDASP